MNKEAGKVMDDIVSAISPFVGDEARIDELRAAVRKVVKLAVETWRYARLERERIEAFMPSMNYQDGDVAEEGFWQPFEIGEGSVTKSYGSQQVTGQLQLRVFPIVRRERVQAPFRISEKDRSDCGCVYSKGFALYID